MTRRTILRAIWITLAVFLLLLSFAVVAYVLKTPTNFEETPNTWDRIFDFLDKWSSAGAPALTLLGILVALGIGVTSLLQTRNMQKREHKTRLLNEIIEWAVAVHAQASERKRGVNKPELHERWAILRAGKRGKVEMAKEIEDTLAVEVKSAVDNFEIVDPNLGAEITTSNKPLFESCIASCEKVIAHAQGLKVKNV